jgi:low affinity Fe/Cu permease
VTPVRRRRRALPSRRDEAHVRRVTEHPDGWFRHFACRVSDAVGSYWAFIAALGVVLAWALTGPLFGFSDSWQLVINTGTTIVTFLMVFLIQATQNRDGKAIQLKLDELIRVQRSARNVFADLEHASEDELQEFEKEFKALRARGLSDKKAVRAAAERATRD